MSVLYLTESDVLRLADVRLALDAVQTAFERLAAGEADNVPRTRARGRGVVLHSMSASADYLGVVGWKNYTTTRTGAQFLVGVHDKESGRLVALIEADALGQLRTGATTGVATQWMADREATELGLFGTGRQAAAQLRAAAAVRPIRQAFVYGRNEERRAQFCERMSEELQIEVEPVDRPQEAAEDLPIVITATSSTEPVFSGEWLAEGALVCAIGSNWLGRAEIDSDVIRRADNIVCDSVEACRREAGDFADALSKGIFDWSRAVDLAAVVSGQATGRNSPISVVLFKSVGLAIEDVALASKLVERARQEGVGLDLPL
jgi:ornithine cyclodeaminase/alanine dehydrogenase